MGRPAVDARVMLKPALLLGGLLLAGAAVRELPAGLDPALLDEAVIGHGLTGDGVFVLVGALLCAVGVPRQAVAFAGGYAFGLGEGLAWSMLAQMLGCAANFLWARLLARAWVRCYLARIGTTAWGGRLSRLDGFLSAHPASATLTLRLLPVGNNLALNLLAGASGVAAGPFLAATLLGYLPQSVVFALLGSGVRVDRGTELALGIALFVAATLLGLWLLRRGRLAGGAAVVAIRPDPA